MPKVLIFEIPEDQYQAFEATLESFLEEINKSRAIMQRDQEDIERLKQETEELKANTRKVAAETRVVLDAMAEKWLKAA